MGWLLCEVTWGRELNDKASTTQRDQGTACGRLGAAAGTKSQRQESQAGMEVREI